jgi:hypothetical protein
LPNVAVSNPVVIRADPTPELTVGAVLVRPDGYIGWAGNDHGRAGVGHAASATPSDASRRPGDGSRFSSWINLHQ